MDRKDPTWWQDHVGFVDLAAMAGLLLFAFIFAKALHFNLVLTICLYIVLWIGESAWSGNKVKQERFAISLASKDSRNRRMAETIASSLAVLSSIEVACSESGRYCREDEVDPYRLRDHEYRWGMARDQVIAGD